MCHHLYKLEIDGNAKWGKKVTDFLDSLLNSACVVCASKLFCRLMLVSLEGLLIEFSK
jgi:hypothetical protein